MDDIDVTCLAVDLAAIIADLPCIAQFGRTTFNCSATGLDSTESLLFEGDKSVERMLIIFPVTAFTVTAAFKPQAIIALQFPDTTGLSNYEIVSIEKTEDGVAYEVILKADERR